MPFAAPTNLDDEELKKKQGQGGVNISGQSTSFQTNIPGQDTGAPKGGAKSSGQYANIQNYLNANQSQADQMGQNIAGQVAQKADDAQSKIQSFESQAPKVNAYDPNQAIQNAQGLNDQQRQEYRQMRQTGGYTGPQSLEQAQGYQETVKAGQEASQKVKNAGTEFGQQQLLKDTYARPTYSQGQNKLDQVLLQNSQGSKTALQGLGQKYAGLDQMLNSATTKVGESINQANQQALANRQAFTPAEEQARKTLIDPIQSRVSQANANNGAYIDRVLGDAGDEVLSDETLAALGLSEGQGLYDLNLQNYINQDRSQVGLNNAANAEERQKYAALQALFDDPTMNQIDGTGKEIKPVGFNKDQFTKDFEGKKAEFDKNYSGDRTVVNGLQLMNFTDAQGNNMNNATPKELEEKWLPMLKASVNSPYGYLYQENIDKINTALNAWKKANGADRKVKKG